MNLTEQRLYALERKTRCINCNTQFFANLAAFPIIGKDDVLYVDESNSNIYIWDGDSYETASGGGGGISDGDKGDITVSGSGTTWTIDNLAVTNAKINDLAFSKITGTPTTLAGYGITDGIDGVGTANELAYFTDSNTIDNLPVATYPSLTELSYVKGTTSAIQTQLGLKANLAGTQTFTGAHTFSSSLTTTGIVNTGTATSTGQISTAAGVNLGSGSSAASLFWGSTNINGIDFGNPANGVESGQVYKVGHASNGAFSWAFGTSYAASYYKMRLTNAGGLLLAHAGFSSGTQVAATSACLDVISTTKGVLLPRMTKTQRDAISSPATGLTIWQTDNTPGLRSYNGTNWMKFTESTD